MIQLKHLDSQLLTSIYHTHMTNDFPQNELKPLQTMLNLMDKGVYLTYGLYDHNELKAYALFVNIPNTSYLLLDYFAVCQTYRSSGYGTLFLNELKHYCKNHIGIIIEIESLHSALDQADYDIRYKRQSFYESNGFQNTELICRLFDVDYTIYFLPLDATWTNSSIYEELKKIYKYLLPSKLYKEKVIFLEKDFL